MNIIGGTIYVVTNGDVWTWNITVKNNSAVTASQVLVTNTVSSGCSYVSDVPSKGTFNPINFEWDIGTLAPNETVTLALTMQVDDMGDAPFNIHSEVSSFGNDATPLDNVVDNTVYDLCNAFGACLAHERLYYVSDISGDTLPNLVAGADPTPACGDIVVLGGGCNDTYMTMYSCQNNAWSAIVQIGKASIHDNKLYVSATPSANTVKGSISCTYDSIQDAVDDASSGDTIHVLAGLYEIEDSINLEGKSGLTFHIEYGAVIKADDSIPAFIDSGDYTGYLRFTGGGLIQADNISGVIELTSTDNTFIVDVDNVTIVNIEGDGIVLDVNLRVANASIVDVSGTHKSVVNTNAGAVIQYGAVFSNVVDNISGGTTIGNMTIDPSFTAHYN